MKSNGHDILKVGSRNEDELPSKLKTYLLEHFAAGWENEAIKVDPPSSYENSYETRTSEPNSEIPAVIKAMKETGCAHEEIKEVVAILANKHQPSYDTRTRLVRESDAELKLRRKKEYDREYQARRYEKRARDAESKNLVRETEVGYISSSLPLEIDTNKEVRDSGIRAREAFERFWRAYPRRQGGNPRKPAEDKFNIALKNGHDPERIIAGADAYALSCRRSNTIGTSYVAHARTWLQHQRWNDDYSDHGGNNARPGPGISTSQPRKENGAQRAVRIAREAAARESGVGLSGSCERVVDLDSSEWQADYSSGVNGRGTGNL